ncbi:hypothetical protein QAD02_014471 [Eretmocerus hayati]|uniref:Uncharacterized protein n=1 Tax=Eretmocerus hayati TaxID=131215 RepID=A0ACC2P513_9HYME|nr:hypothetical protein QAD02_014471 [Eretmocerus hayati]
MADLFDIANLITTVGVDAVKIKPEPGLPEKSSNEILSELFSTFDVPDGDSDSGDSKNGEDNLADKEKPTGEESESTSTPTSQLDPNVKIKQEKDESKKKKSKKKHKHKNESKDKDKKHKHKKKSKYNSSESASDPENPDSKRKKKRKKSKRNQEPDQHTNESDEPSSKIRRLDDTEGLKKKDSDDAVKSKTSEAVKIKQEKTVESKDETSMEKVSNSTVPPVSRLLDDDAEALTVPKLLEKSKNLPAQKIIIKDLKNSEVYNKTVKEIEDKEKEKALHMEDGEITDSDDDENRTPSLSPSPPRDQSSKMRSDRRKYSTSSNSKRTTKKHDLRLVLEEREKKRRLKSERSSSKTNQHDDRDNSRSRDHSKKRSHSVHSKDRRTRSRSGDRGRHGRGRSRERNSRARSRSDRDNYSSRSEDRNRSRRRGRSRSRERKERIEIDKKKLLEIARKNAINMIKKGTMPIAQQDKFIAAIQAGGKTIEELTDFCKNLSKSEAMGELSSISSGDESGSEKGFHHPFLVKDRPSSIIMNIRDSKQLPTKTLLEKTAEASGQLRLQYPVSSGQQHRKNEKDWVPVPVPPPKKPSRNSRNSKGGKPKLFIPAKEVLHNPPLPLVIPPYAEQQAQQTAQATLPDESVQPTEATYLPPQQPIAAQPENDQSIFPPVPTQPLDISTIVSQRLAAMRKLSENPHDVQALSEMYKAQSGMKTWVESKQVPGQFTGSTGARVLTPAELNSGHQAWARKDQLLTAQPVSGGMGMALLQKMGWKPGEGLGKNKEGALEPLKLEVKLDKRGLVSDQDIGATRLGKVSKSQAVPKVKNLEGKHPVSFLGEYCSKYKLEAPVYELCSECGPDHKKNFLFKVRVNGVEYQPTVGSPNKKLAKAEAAQVCLQSIGLVCQ